MDSEEPVIRMVNMTLHLMRHTERRDQIAKLSFIISYLYKDEKT